MKRISSKKILLSVFALLLFSGAAFAQGNITITSDLDGDGKQDKFWLSKDKLQYQLSTQKNVTKSSKPLDIEGLNNSLKISKGVITVSLWAMRSGTEYKFRYDKIQGDFRVIGYDSENFGPATNDGSGKSSYNLLTGDYVANWHHYDLKQEKLIALPAIKKKAPAKRYFLTGFDDKVRDEISSVDNKFLPPVLK